MKPFTLTNKKSPPRPCRQITGIPGLQIPEYDHIKEVERLVQHAKNSLYSHISDELHTKMHNLYMYI